MCEVKEKPASSESTCEILVEAQRILRLGSASPTDPGASPGGPRLKPVAEIGCFAVGVVASCNAETIPGRIMGEFATSVAAPPQHLRALEQANRVRLARAELKRRVAAQATTVADVILDCPWEAESMALSDLLMSQRRWGRARCRRVLLSLGLPENKQIGTMTDRQRRALASTLKERCDSRSRGEHSFTRDDALVAV
jgi:hypothetical protein